MLFKTSGIALSSVRYGENSLIVRIFTRLFGQQSYMVQGIRGGKTRSNKTASFQPGTLLELVVYNHSEKNLQRISEFRMEHIYSAVQEDVTRNCILLFVVELLGLLLSEQGPMPDLYDFSAAFLLQLDSLPARNLANMPLYFATACGRFFGFDPIEAIQQRMDASPMAPDFGHTEIPIAIYFTDPEKQALHALYQVKEWSQLADVSLNGDLRFQLMEKLSAFYFSEMHRSCHLKSLPVLKSILQ